MTWGLLGAWLLAPGRANGQVEVSVRQPPAIVQVAGSKIPKPRPLPVEGAGEGMVKATVTGPEFRAPQLLQGFEDYYHPRLKRLREEYSLDRVVEGESSEFRRILKLRHWVHTRWLIDNDQNFSGDAFAILEKAKTGAGFHCAHCMIVQQAVLSAMGYVARYVLVDRNHEDLGRSVHHGVDEVWSNDYAKWVLLDAKYDVHFERDGAPLSALELHEAVRADGGRGIVMVRGVERGEIPMDDPQAHEASVRSYWWVCYPLRQNPFTEPDFAARERLVIFDNEAFRKSTWYRDHGAGLTPHWAYAAGAFVPTADRTQIEWTPGVADLRVRQAAAAALAVEIRGATPNLEAYVVRLNEGPPQTVSDGRVQWQLRAGENTLQVRSRNLFGVLGPSLMATVVYEPADRPQAVGTQAQGERPAQGLASKHPGDAALDAVKPAQSPPLRVAFVTPAATQPHLRDRAVIFYEDFDRLPDWRTRYFDFVDPNGSFVWTAGEGLRGGAMRCQFAKGQVSAGGLQALFGKNPFGRGIRPDETFREIWWRVYVKHEAGWEGNPAKLAWHGRPAWQGETIVKGSSRTSGAATATGSASTRPRGSATAER